MLTKVLLEIRLDGDGLFAGVQPTYRMFHPILGDIVFLKFALELSGVK